MFGCLSISSGALNKGNIIIEEATWRLLGRRPDVSISSFGNFTDRDVECLMKCDQVVLPGATMLDAKEHSFAPLLTRLSCDLLPIGVALSDQSKRDLDLTIARSISGLVGSRDPYTHKSLLEADLPSRFVGCSTLFLGSAKDWSTTGDRVVCSLGLDRQSAFRKCVDRLSQSRELDIIQHVPELEDKFVTNDNVTWHALESLDQLERIYSSASVVVTGRLHGALPALAMGIPIVFVTDHWDSRFTLLEWLGIERWSMEPELICDQVDYITDGRRMNFPLNRINELKDSMNAFLSETILKKS